MISFTIRFPPIRPRQDSFAIDLAVQEGARLLVSFVREITPGNNVRLDWRMEQNAKGNWRVFNPKPIAKFLEYGTGIYGPKHLPIPIQAKRVRALKFEGSVPVGYSMRRFQSGPRGGMINPDYQPSWDAPISGTVFRKRALVKGIKPRFYFATAKEATIPEIKSMIAAAARIKLEEELFGVAKTPAGRRFSGSATRRSIR